MKYPSQTLAEHIAANLAMAADQVGSFTDPQWNAFDSYAQNLLDSVLADGWTDVAAADAVATYWNLAHAAGFKGSQG